MKQLTRLFIPICLETLFYMLSGMVDTLSICNQFYSDLVTKVQHGIDVPGTTIHVFYATKMGKKYEKRYWTYFKNPDIRRHNMQHEELFCCHSAEWVKEVKKSVEGDRQ